MSSWGVGVGGKVVAAGFRWCCPLPFNCIALATQALSRESDENTPQLYFASVEHYLGETHVGSFTLPCAVAHVPWGMMLLDFVRVTEVTAEEVTDRAAVTAGGEEATSRC